MLLVKVITAKPYNDVGLAMAATFCFLLPSNFLFIFFLSISLHYCKSFISLHFLYHFLSVHTRCLPVFSVFIQCALSLCVNWCLSVVGLNTLYKIPSLSDLLSNKSEPAICTIPRRMRRKFEKENHRHENDRRKQKGRDKKRRKKEDRSRRNKRRRDKKVREALAMCLRFKKQKERSWRRRARLHLLEREFRRDEKRSKKTRTDNEYVTNELPVTLA